MVTFKKLNSCWFILALALVHLWSALGVAWPLWNLAGFITLTLLCLALALIDLRLSVLLFCLELLIGSKGYIFSLPLGGLTLSIRIAMWLIIMSVWLGKLMFNFKISWVELKSLCRSASGKYWLILALACLVGALIGLRNNNWSDLFFDGNNWAFLLIAWPIWFNFKTKDDLSSLAKIFFIGIAWLSLETLALGYVFSHNLGAYSAALYVWLRRTGLAEITWTPNGFWRIFLQSQLYLVIAMLGLYVMSAEKKITDNKLIKNIFQSAIILSALFFSLSRSLWLGLAIAVAVIMIIAWSNWRQTVKLILTGLMGLGLTYIFVWCIFTLSLGNGASSFDTFISRTNVTTEAAASSRWNLWPIIWQKIKLNPIFGQGLGATVVYQSNDPRILAQNTGGWHKTYALEWGWLDFWLKLGLWGLLVYLLWLLSMIKALLKLKQPAADWLAVSLIGLMVIHFFTPYLNHPLGLITVIISATALKIWQTDQALA